MDALSWAWIPGRSALATPSVVFAAAESLVWAQAFQTILLGGYLLVLQRHVVIEVMHAWQLSLLAGAMGAAGSACWFTAMAMQPTARVRTSSLIEFYFSYVVSRRVFRSGWLCWRRGWSGSSACAEAACKCRRGLRCNLQKSAAEGRREFPRFQRS